MVSGNLSGSGEKFSNSCNSIKFLWANHYFIKFACRDINFASLLFKDINFRAFKRVSS